ncbi:MAG: histidine kinase dimerization/phospho-acceptor domain-containing protein [Acidobacteriota bacterium]
MTAAMLFVLGLAVGVAAGAFAVRARLRKPRLQRQRATRSEEHQESRRREAKAEETRRQLLADVSHELATPLTAIRGGAETLLDASVTLGEPERNRMLGDILAASNRMQVLIEDLFDLTRLEAGATALHTERLDWSSLCGHLVARYGDKDTAGET